MTKAQEHCFIFAHTYFTISLCVYCFGGVIISYSMHVTQVSSQLQDTGVTPASVTILIAAC